MNAKLTNMPKKPSDSLLSSSQATKDSQSHENNKAHLSDFLRRAMTFAMLFIAFAIPFEHKYDKFFRHFSKTLIPQNIYLPAFFDYKIYFYISDLIAFSLGIAALFFFKIPLRQFFCSKSAQYLWLLFVLSALSITLSPLSNYVIPYSRLLQLLTPILLFCWIANFYQEAQDKIDITNSIFIAISAAALLQSMIAIGQYVYQSPMGLRFLGEISEFSTFYVPNGKKWLFDHLIRETPQEAVLLRSSGTLPHANVLGGFLCSSLIAGYALFFYYPKFRRWIILSIPIQIFALCLTFSRSALFSWLLATSFWFGHHIASRGWKTSFKDQGIRILGATIAASFLFSTCVLYEQFWFRGGIVNYEESLAQKSDEGRSYYQNLAMQLIEKHPWQGVGFQQLSLRTVELTGSPSNSYDPSIGTHNIYLYIAAEAGIPALIAFCLFISSLLWAALKAKFTPHISSLLAIFIAFLFIGCCDFYPILFQQGKLLFFLSAGLLAAHGCYEKTPFKKAAPLS